MPTSNSNNNPQMSLADEIRFQIKTHGPMSVATYMRLCLTHPTKGYYKKHDPLGKKGDFVTAPEISQMFGEMMGVWVHMYWQILGCPSQFDLVELGPGRGTLMADAVRGLASDPKANAALNLVLLETNPVLIDLQRVALHNYNPIWIEELHQLADRPNPKIIIANEFFDALPIKQFQFNNGQWYERVVGEIDEKLAWGLSPTPLPKAAISPKVSHPKQGEIWETCPLALQTMAQIGALLNQHDGAMMMLDYGYETTQTGETFQAIQNHKFADPLAEPGQADLTAHVDFEALADAARNVGTPARIYGTQRQLLIDLGIEQRAQNLIKANPQKASAIQNDIERLIGTKQMGKLFKSLHVFASPKPPMKKDPALTKIKSISHGFFGRQGGVSPQPFTSLNMSKSMGDQLDNVANNRTLACASLNFSPSKLVLLKQVHSADIIVIDESFDFTSSPEADGMVCKTPNIALGILTADCTPVLFADPEAGVVGACHAGWQGAVNAIIARTIEAMENLGANRKRIIAAFGPTIWVDNYEVGEKWAVDFLAKHPKQHRFLTKPDNTGNEHFDLPAFVRADLENNQIAHISQVGGCTYQNPQEYFSHRYATHNSAQTGRQIAIIGLS